MIEPVAVSFASVAAATFPAASVRVPCGFPSPAQDYKSGELDLVKHLIRDPASTYIWEVSGDSMVDAGIYDGSLLIVDRGIEPASGKIVVAVIDSEFTVKHLDTRSGRPVLRAANPGYPDIEVPELSELTIWGVVSFIITPAPGARAYVRTHE